MTMSLELSTCIGWWTGSILTRCASQATLSWLRLCLHALHLTGEGRYAEAMERTLHNALLGALRPGGHWRTYFLELEGRAAPSTCRYPEIPPTLDR